MPFGLTNAPATFQALMNTIFRPFLRRFVLIFFDDILVYSVTWDLHLQHVTAVLQLLTHHQLFAKLSKCAFGQSKVDYLGHVISVQGVEVDPDKVQVVRDWPTPTSVTHLKAFLGLSGYYRRFIRSYAQIASPLTDLLKRDSFVWSDRAQAAFDQLKRVLTEALVLTLPDFSQSFTLETDASGSGVGAVLSQQSHPIAFFSRKLSPRMQAQSVYVRELYAITAAVAKFRHYLFGHHFVIKTDHASLRYLRDQVLQTPEQVKYLPKLLGYNFDIEYRAGNLNVAADALSRVELLALTYVEGTFLDQVQQ